MTGSRNNLRILLVEDDVDDYLLTREVLAELPETSCTLDWAATYEAALEMAAAWRHDAYLIDYRLGAHTGLELVREMIVRGHTAPIIVITGEGDRVLGTAAMAAGAADYLLKNELNASVLERSLHYARERTRRSDRRDKASQGAERSRLNALIMEAPTAIAFLHGPDYQVEVANMPYLESIGKRDVLDRPLFAVVPELIEQGLRALMDQVRATGEPFQGKERPVQLDFHGDGVPEIRYFDIAFQPLRGPDSVVEGILVHAANVTEGVLARRRIEQQAQQMAAQVKRLSGLRAIDMAITASLDLKFTLGVILEQVTSQLGADAAQVLVLNEPTQMLEPAAGRGFKGMAAGRLRLRLGQGHAGRAALDRCLVISPDLRGEEVIREPLVGEERFVAYFAVPLIAKGHVRGVLEVLHRAALTPDDEWLDYLNALAGQTAIAIDSSLLFTSLQRSNSALILAYDTTIEGWSRTLDLRDKETEGHSKRVTEMSIDLARIMGMDDIPLLHTRRGALLHDIGKMGVPDAILFKPGPLSDEEWTIMRRHPTFANDLLSPIAYLRPALDIPYCHHEKWDGSGYPRGLVGEQIPLAARIFAVVDVWDALVSDRPYRAAWPVEKVRAHVLALAGSHFDPAVVAAFLAPTEDEGRQIAATP